MANANLIASAWRPHGRGQPVQLTRRLKPKRCGAQIMLGGMLCALGIGAHAELPLAVESLLTDQGTLKLNLSLAYSNRTAAFLNSDAVVGTATLRYGLTGNLDIYARGSGQYRSVRTSSGATTGTRFVNTWAGASYQFKRDTETPALIGFVEGSLFERGSTRTYSLKSWIAGLTAYKAIDPVVFMLAGYYRFDLPRNDGGSTVHPGHAVAVNPSVAFAVNDRVAFNTGVRWTHDWPTQVGDNTHGFRATNTYLQLGVDYGLSDDNILNVTFSSHVSGTGGAQLRFDWLHTF